MRLTTKKIPTNILQEIQKVSSDCHRSYIYFRTPKIFKRPWAFTLVLRTEFYAMEQLIPAALLPMLLIRAYTSHDEQNPSPGPALIVKVQFEDGNN